MIVVPETPLPLPPYSPELNPIERTWANLKNRVTELMKVKTSVTDCLVYCLKT
ncbi:transposase [Enterococcus faecium]|uniref:transposase n=1 Tax=Enterococcus faecium TaxID=1352 RepID=UPI00351F11F3